MLNSGNKIRDKKKKKNSLTLVLSENFFLNERKNHTPPPPTPFQVKWSFPYMIGDFKPDVNKPFE